MAHLQKQANGVIHADVHAPEWLHKFIIGKKGENISRIIQDCPKVLFEFLQGKDKIQVEGPQNEVMHAVAALQDNINELESRMDFAEVEIEQQFHKHIIGKAGADIRRIRDETGVMILIPMDADNSNIIRIEGDRKGVERAKQQVMEIASRMEKNIKQEVIIDQRFHKFFIDAKGNTIQGIQQQFNQVQITFPDPGKRSDIVTLRGPKSDVDKCAVYLDKTAKELECEMDFAEIEIEQQFHKHIIGKAGTEIRRIINETGVMIHIPPDAENNPIILIEGESKGVERAKQQLMEMASRMEKKKTKQEVTIDQRFHKFFIDAKGNTIQGIQRQFNQVQITFPDQGKRSDIVTLRGPKSDVDKCAVYLDKTAKELERQMHFAEIEIEQQFHKHIIGKAGAEIRRIINETGVMIHIPPDTENNPIILIEGESKGVERAKQQLMEMASRMEKKKTKQEVTIDQRFHRFFIDAKGSTIQGIRRQFNQVQITFPDQGKRSDIVTLRGPKSDVDKCAVYLDKTAKELIREETKTRVDLPSEISYSDVITITGKEVAHTKIEKIKNEQFITETGKRRIMIGEVSRKSDLRSYHCNVCNKKFSRKKRMKKHKRYHKVVRPLVKRFPKKKGVRQYKRDQKDYQHYVCSVYKKDDSEKTKLWHHKDFRRYDCSICGEEHLKKREQWQHLHHQKDFRCSKHDEEYSERRETCQHLHLRKGISTYQCDICGKRFPTKREMKEHRRHKDIRPYQCNICDDGYSTQWDLWQHLRVHKDFRCNKCNDFDEEYPEKMQPQQHFPAYKDFRPSERIIKRMEAVGHGRHCKNLTLYEIGGFQEILRKTEERKLCKSCQCKFCRKRFFRNSEAEQGDLNHHKCDFCDEIFSTMNELEQHKKRHEEFRPHQCDICVNRFSTKSRMEQHMRDHKDVRRYQCDICGKKFSTKKGMKDHKRGHMDVGHYQCDICGTKFSTKTKMEEHRRHHAGNLTHHKCDFCDEIFSTMNELEQHKKHHEEFRPYQCDVCNERFSTKNGMEQHKKCHKDIKSYQCDICEKKFTTKRGMEQHRQHHYRPMVLSKRQ